MGRCLTVWSCLGFILIRRSGPIMCSWVSFIWLKTYGLRGGPNQRDLTVASYLLFCWLISPFSLDKGKNFFPNSIILFKSVEILFEGEKLQQKSCKKRRKLTILRWFDQIACPKWRLEHNITRWDHHKYLCRPSSQSLDVVILHNYHSLMIQPNRSANMETRVQHHTRGPIHKDICRTSSRSLEVLILNNYHSPMIR